MYHYNTHSHRLKPREECKDVPQEVRIVNTCSTPTTGIFSTRRQFPMKLVQPQDNSHQQRCPREIPGDSGLCPTDRGKRDREEAGDQTLVFHSQVPQVSRSFVLMKSTFLCPGKEDCRHRELSKEEKGSQELAVTYGLQSARSSQEPDHI